MIPRPLPVYRGARCRCGAARRPQKPICIKCDARNRWQRRTTAARPRTSAVVTAASRRRPGRARSRGADR